MVERYDFYFKQQSLCVEKSQNNVIKTRLDFHKPERENM